MTVNVDPRPAWRIVRFFLTWVALFVVWLLFSADVRTFSVVAGLLGCAAIAGLTYDEFIAEHDASWRSFLPNPWWLVVFLVYLLYALFRSSLAVTAAVFSGRATPRFVHIRTRLRTDLARMVLANSITFTPGTITLDLDDDHLTVHWFFATTGHAKAAGEAIKADLERLIAKVWR